MAIQQDRRLREISGQFQIYGEMLHAETCQTGHINETFSASYNQGGTRIRYLHQKINSSIFRNPAALMKNILRVTAHIQQKLEAQQTLEITRRSLTVVPARDGKPFYRTSAGEFWRTFVFVEGAQTMPSVQSPAQAFETGRAFGEFQRLLVDLPGKRLVETIPHFHDTRGRFDSLRTAVAADHLNRAKSARSEIEFALRHEIIVDVILRAMKQGKIPERITHNDTKFNNVLLDRQTGRALCVVDLDTVMPGCVLHDFGDMVRSATSTAVEDERDLATVKMQMPMFKKLAEGYWSMAGKFLNRAEKALLAFSGRLIAFELGLRFLSDYLNGDAYFRTHRPGQNLDRCRAQFKLVESIARQEDRMQKFVDGL